MPAMHAGGQVVHFGTRVEHPLKAWIMGGNANLPPDIQRDLGQGDAGRFHAPLRPPDAIAT